GLGRPPQGGGGGGQPGCSRRRRLYEMARLTPVARILADPAVLAVLTSSPYNTLADLIEDAKKRPGVISYGSSGHYGASHVPMEMFLNAAGPEAPPRPLPRRRAALPPPPRQAGRQNPLGPGPPAPPFGTGTLPRPRQL